MNDDNGKVIVFERKRPMSLREALVQSLKQDKKEQDDHFDDAYAALLRIRARLATGRAEGLNENKLDKLYDREGDALWDVIHTRAVHRWQINRKLQLLETLL